MKEPMKQVMNQHGASVFAGGLVLALTGAYAMWSGWDLVQLERGWASFIAGASMLSAGAVTMALGRVIAAIRDLARQPVDTALVEPRAPDSKPTEKWPKAPARPSAQPARQQSSASEAPVEVDRYVAGGAEYVMFSDGSVEVRSGGYAQRYSSLAALRTEAERHI